MRSKPDFEEFGAIPDPFADTADVPPPPAIPMSAMGSSPARGHVRGMRVGALALAMGYELLGILVLKARPDFATMPVWTLALGFCIPALGTALALGAATRDGERGLGEPVHRLMGLTIGAPVLFLLATLLLAPHAADDAFWHHAWACFVTSAGLAAGPLLFGAWALRGAFVTAARWRFAALGIACGAVAATVLSVVCPNGTAFHVVLGHGGIMLAMGLAGALVGRKVAGA